MKVIAGDIAATVSGFVPVLKSLDDAAFAEKLPGKWSKKEILGHLVDSAQNNLQRFIRAQYEDMPPAITYQQDDWVALGYYQGYSKDDIIQLWLVINAHLCHVLTNMDPTRYDKQCMTSGKELKPLTFFAGDYHRHMVHHLNQINPVKSIQ